MQVRDDGNIIHNELIVGRVTEAAVEGDGNPVPQTRIILNLGWCKAAGLGVTIQDDPDVDHHRGGVALER